MKALVARSADERSNAKAYLVRYTAVFTPQGWRPVERHACSVCVVAEGFHAIQPALEDFHGAEVVIEIRSVKRVGSTVVLYVP